MAKGLRPGRCYKWDSPAYTRISNNPSDSFITGIPGSKIIRFDMGNLKSEFDSSLAIAPKQDVIIRHNSLEAARIVVQRNLEKNVGVVNYRFKINVFPHHVFRENVMASGAGADRVQDGMRKAFGKPMGRAARVHKGQPIFTLYFNFDEARFDKMKLALKTAIKKLPGDYALVAQRSVEAS